MRGKRGKTLFIQSSLSTLLLLSLLITPSLSKSTSTGDDEEDLSFLEEAEDDTVPHHTPLEDCVVESDDEDFGSFDDFEPTSEYGHEGDKEAYSNPQIDEKDVVVLKEGIFSDFIKSNRYVMVEFYDPWCGHCQALAPEYEEAATELKGGVQSVDFHNHHPSH